MTFTYSGRDLDAPLLRLLQSLQAQAADLLSKLKQYVHDNENDFVRWASMGPTESTAERNERAHKYLVTLTRVRETELWLYECRRRPRATWELTLEKLAELYPTQIAPETTAEHMIEKRGWLKNLF